MFYYIFVEPEQTKVIAGKETSYTSPDQIPDRNSVTKQFTLGKLY